MLAKFSQQKPSISDNWFWSRMQLMLVMWRWRVFSSLSSSVSSATHLPSCIWREFWRSSMTRRLGGVQQVRTGKYAEEGELANINFKINSGYHWIKRGNITLRPERESAVSEMQWVCQIERSRGFTVLLFSSNWAIGGVATEHEQRKQPKLSTWAYRELKILQIWTMTMTSGYTQGQKKQWIKFSPPNVSQL